jgi:hypothetical protein
MVIEDHRVCLVCNKTKNEHGRLLTCSKCKVANYCSREHQKKDWKSHKQWCYAVETKSPNHWWEKEHKCGYCSEKHQWNMPCTLSPFDTGCGPHQGRPELIIWNFTDDQGTKTGWGGVPLRRSAALRNKFEQEFNFDEEKLAKHETDAFRWTCCGTSLGQTSPCDHHGRGPTKCTCDFCVQGLPLSPAVSEKKSNVRYGLDLPLGPDPRSLNPMAAQMAAMMRPMYGMPE